MFHNIRINCDLSLTERPVGSQCSGRRANQPRCLCHPSFAPWKIRHLNCLAVALYALHFFSCYLITFCSYVRKRFEHEKILERLLLIPLLEVTELREGGISESSVLKITGWRLFSRNKPGKTFQLLISMGACPCQIVFLWFGCE